MIAAARSRWTLVLVLSMALTAAAHAQLSAYVTFSPAHLSNVETGAVYSATGYTEATASYWSSGIGGGLTLPILRLPVVSLGLDLRGSTRPGTAGVDSALLGLKLTVHPHVIPFKPYIQVSGGYLDTRTTNLTTSSSGGTTGGTFSNKYGAYEILGGVDYPLIHFVDYRIVEIGAGKGVGLDNYNPTFVTVNTGVVVHF
jgi:hypothetical protein